MPGPISSHFVETHAELDRALRDCMRSPGQVDLPAFDRFRRALLHHIAQEERVLMPALAKKLGSPPPFRNALRKDHAGFAALCVPLPEREWVENLGELFAHHAAVEEGPGGLYERCDAVLGPDSARVIARADALSPITLPPLSSGPLVRPLLAELLRATGIDGAAD